MYGKMGKKENMHATPMGKAYDAAKKSSKKKSSKKKGK